MIKKLLPVLAFMILLLLSVFITTRIIRQYKKDTDFEKRMELAEENTELKIKNFELTRKVNSLELILSGRKIPKGKMVITEIGLRYKYKDAYYISQRSDGAFVTTICKAEYVKTVKIGDLINDGR